MKKITSLLIMLCICVSTCILLASCNHTHKYKTEWAKNEKNHWHECEDNTCTEVSDKSEHTWNDGKITTEATSETDGEKTYTCTVCNATKTESIKFEGHVHNFKSEWSNDAENHWHVCDSTNCAEISDKTAHTWGEGKISAESANVKIFTCTVCKATKEETIKNKSVTKAEWDALFNPELYRNVTCKTTQIDNFYKTENISIIADGYIYISTTFYNSETNQPSESTSHTVKLTDEMYSASVPTAFNYEDFEYDQENDVYILTKKINTNMGPHIAEYTKIIITLKDGKIWKQNFELSYNSSENGEKIDVTIYAEYSNYGTSVIPQTNS
jgi:hypothetical protein